MDAILITGASRGIGRAAAKKMASSYEAIVLVSEKNVDLLGTLRQEILDEHLSRNVFIYEGDVSRAEFWGITHQNLKEKDIFVSTLINNAAISNFGLLIDTTPEEWQRMIDVNLTGVFLGCRTFLHEMISRERGRILNISSIYSEIGAACEAPYSATKAGVNALTKSLSLELASNHIPVNAIAFGAVDTDMNRRLTAEEKAVLSGDIPFGRMMTVDEAADAIKKVLELPEYLTGEIIRMDGGWSLS